LSSDWDFQKNRGARKFVSVTISAGRLNALETMRVSLFFSIDSRIDTNEIQVLFRNHAQPDAGSLLRWPVQGGFKSGELSGPDKITFVTDWKAQAEHGGFYQAVAKGFYAKHGIDMHIMQGGPAVNVPQLLAGGAADFGIGSNGFIPLNMVREGVRIRAVMAAFQKDPQCL